MESIFKNRWLAAVIVAVFFYSCDNEGGDPEPEETTVNYVMALRAQDANDESADYLLTVNELMSGEISAEGQGVEEIGWNYNGHFGDTFFSFGYDLNECIGYKVENGHLIEQGKFVFERFDVMNPIDDESFMAIGAPWGGGSFDCQLQVVNIEDIAIHKNVKHPIYEYFHEGEQLNAWPTASYLDGDKLFVSFYPLNGVSWETPNTDTAYVSVYSYPELEYLSTFKDARTGPIGYYANQPCILENESGDHFTISAGAYSTGFSQKTKPSAILKINAGETEFDEDYFFNVEESGYRVTSAVYMGDGKVVAKVVTPEVDEAAASVSKWALFSEVTPLLNVAILDLNDKTVTIVDDVPLHGGQYATPFLIEDGKAYISVNDGTDAYVYQVDPSTVSATRGAKLIGNQFQGLFSNK